MSPISQQISANVVTRQFDMDIIGQTFFLAFFPSLSLCIYNEFSLVFLTYETKIVLFLAVQENSVLPMG